jgi:peroxiredoxin-like protein
MTVATVHHYPVTVEWSGGRDGAGRLASSRSGFTADLTAAEEFGGPGQGANPEELLTCAVASCYSITLGIVAAHKRLPVVKVDVDATGEVEQAGTSFTFKAVALMPRIVLAAGATPAQVEQALALAHRAEAYCIVTKAIREKVTVTVTPDVSVLPA